MSRYIDADALDRDGWTASRTYSEDNHTMTYEVKKLTDFPTADVRENVHSFWEEAYRPMWDGTRYWFKMCHNCGYERVHNPDFDTPFCPKCGAIMKGEEE